MVALVAPSGAGKSTLLHIAGLLEHPDSGEVFIVGEMASKLGDDARTALRRRQIGFVYQFHHLLPEFSALENVVLPQMIAGLRGARRRSGRKELLDYLQVGQRADASARRSFQAASSSVWRSRARSRTRRALLLADEPTGNLDPKTAGHVFAALKTAGARVGPRRADRHAQLRAGRGNGPHGHHRGRGDRAGESDLATRLCRLAFYKHEFRQAHRPLGACSRRRSNLHAQQRLAAGAEGRRPGHAEDRAPGGRAVGGAVDEMVGRAGSGSRSRA